MLEVRPLNAAEENRQYIGALAAVLLDCVAGGASVGFMASLSKHEAESFFEKAFESAERGDRIILAAFIDSKLIGIVQIVTATPPNQPHRAGIHRQTPLVHRSARGHGVCHAPDGTCRASRPPFADKARSSSWTLSPEETPEKLYLRMGWTKTGIIPNYARFPDGRPCDTTILWKDIA